MLPVAASTHMQSFVRFGWPAVDPFSDVVYVIECLSVHSVIASRMSSKLSAVSGWTGWSTRTVQR